MLNVPVKYFTTFNKSSNINVKFLIRGNAAAIFAYQDTIAEYKSDIDKNDKHLGRHSGAVSVSSKSEPAVCRHDPKVRT